MNQTARSSTWFSRSDMPYEDPQTTISRIVDNRLRAVRFWMAKGQGIDDKMIKFVLGDLMDWINRFDARVETAWMIELKARIAQLDLGKTSSLKAVYEHIGHEYPRLVEGSSYFPPVRDSFYDDIYGDRRRPRRR